MPIDDSFSALFVPTDAPVRQVQIRDQATIDGLIGGYATSHRLDADTTIFLITHDRKDDLAFNSLHPVRPGALERPARLHGRRASRSSRRR